MMPAAKSESPATSAKLKGGRRFAAAVAACLFFAVLDSVHAKDLPGAVAFHSDIQPLLKEFCFDCHGDGASKGQVAFDAFASDSALLEDHDLWWRAMKNLRSNLMPPPKKAQPSAEQKQKIEQWIKTSVFVDDPNDPNPGHVTVRRLNRVEYRNTIRDLIGVDFETEKEFPPDDSGLGFDTIGASLTLPPMLLEKYLAAAKTIVSKAVPKASREPAETIITGKTFSSSLASTNRAMSSATPGVLSYYERASASHSFQAEHPGHYLLLVDLSATERYVENQFDYNKCRLVVKVRGKEVFQHDYAREGTKPFHYEFEQEWTEGGQDIVFEVEPLTPDKKQVRSLSLRIDSVTVRGPLASNYWVQPKNYARFFPKPVPTGTSARRKYAKEILEPFVVKAFRHPADKDTVRRLIELAEATYQRPGKTFEEGIGQSMVAVLASPRFLFREEGVETKGGSKAHPYIDQYSLASRLSYFLWSSMPDETLLRLAGEGKLRQEVAEQTRRMLADPKAEGLVRNFSGQWLQTRDIDTVPIDSRAVLRRENAPDPDADRRRQRSRELQDIPDEKRTEAEKKELDGLRASFAQAFNRPPRAELNNDLRKAMRLETEKTFDYILRGDRSLLELLDSDYTFLNERLAKHYGLTNLNVTGDQMRLVKLPAGSMRGGVITEGSVLAVTSNPTRTSPVKRGRFILDNLIGSPPPPPPPDIPPLEDAAKAIKDRVLSLRETLALHREQPLCSSCHNRMDPLGLALENFNALGMWRDQERGQAIDATGVLMSGEKFGDVQELKHILVTRHATEFYRTITEKLLTYALGRGLEYYDVATVDSIVSRLEQSNGRASILIGSIVESAPFQKTGSAGPNSASKTSASVNQHAEIKASP